MERLSVGAFEHARNCRNTRHAKLPHDASFIVWLSLAATPMRRDQALSRVGMPTGLRRGGRSALANTAAQPAVAGSDAKRLVSARQSSLVASAAALRGA